MSEKRTLSVPAELVKKIDEKRGGMRRSDFIDFLVESYLGQGSKEQHYVTKDELEEFEQGIKGLLRSCLEFFVNFGLEMARQPVKGKSEQLDQQLEGLAGTLGVREQEGSAAAIDNEGKEGENESPG